MSADRQRLKSAIQRIAKEDPEIRNLLGEGQNKGGKPGSAGVGTSEVEESRLCCDGSTSDNANPGTSERDPDASSQDGLDSDDPAKLGSGEGSLTGVTDCATGEPVCFDGGGHIEPAHWTDRTTDPEWEPDSGEFWTAGALSFDTRTKGQAKAFLMEMDGSSVWTEFCQFSEDTEDRVTAEYARTDGTECGGYSAQVGRQICGETGHPLEPDYCGTDYKNPTSEELNNNPWPEDGCTNLAIVNGSIVGSKYDPENDGSYSKPRSEMQLCDAEGNQISIRPAGTGVLPTGEQTSVPERITGGWKTFNSTTSNGYLYDSSGRQIAHIDGNEYSDPNV